jgi:GT2 family glycosyltransferase
MNRKELLEQCLGSILRQTYQNIQIVVIDDAGTDNTATLIQEEYQPVALIRNEINQGASAAKNQGALLAKGTYVWFLDSDSFAGNPDALAFMVNYMESHPNVGAIGGEVHELPNGDRRMPIKSIGPNGESVSAYLPPDQVKELACDYLATCNCLVKKELLETVGGFDPAYGVLSEDKEICYRITRQGYKIIADGRCAVDHRFQENKRAGDLGLKYRNNLRFVLINMPWTRILFLPILEIVSQLSPNKLSALKQGRREVLKHLSPSARQTVQRADVSFARKLLALFGQYAKAIGHAYWWNLKHLSATLAIRSNRPNFLLQQQSKKTTGKP